MHWKEHRMVRVKILLMGLPLLVVLFGAVYAAVYFILQLTATVIVSDNPKVCFVRWSDGSKQNTFDYTVNTFPSVTTIDENITHGIWNWDSESHVVYMRWYSLTNSDNIASLNVTVYNSTHTVYTQYWSSVPSLPTSWVQFTTMANGKYAIWIEITAASGANGSSVFTLEMKVEN